MDKPPNKTLETICSVLRIIAALICAFLLYTFIYTMSLKQINHGNVIGCLYCGSVIVLIIAYPFLKKKKPLRIAANVCGCILAAFAVYCAVISCFIVSEMNHGEDKALAVSSQGTPQTVIVLGCMVLDGEPSPMLALRIGKAEEYLKAHPDAVCIAAGGKGSNEEISEAECIRRCLVRDGIDESRIYIEDKSVDTTENIRFSKEIIDAEGLSEEVVVVSECYHIFRGVRQARLNGLHASGIYPDPAPVIKTMPSYWLREIFAISRDLFFA
ncbi:MAG: YdcF family protein [Ruminiclostridium sp.]|nr:YdcF family protein [Ruminiclostridium sp.]